MNTNTISENFDEYALAKTVNAPMAERMYHDYEMSGENDSPMYMPGFFRSQIGRVMRVEFYLGSQLVDRVGRLVQVGSSYIVLQGMDPNSSIMCDLSSVKFATIVSNQSTDSIIF